ncbi:glycosylphosphatidylinositol anchor biosynthesis [Ophidiomyces ophidiicola]|nr:glycosylphosphatidylinositol anchor biosynthesis [Ophidiomyces ophidiicola]
MVSSPSRPRLSGRPAPTRRRIAARDLLLFLVAFRILNALCVNTFFQPDEFFQSLEPAWQLTFGRGSGAWITWEWKHHLRSALHPYLFAAVYSIADQLSRYARLSPLGRADLLIAAPKATQGIVAALGDYYTWRLAERAFGQDSWHAWWTLGLTILSPWQWFCSTRTFSNCLETTLTIAALCYWPWGWSVSDTSRKVKTPQPDGTRTLAHLRSCLVLAALACVLRPTNLIIWLSLVVCTVFKTIPRDGLLSIKHVTLIREATGCGFSVFLLALFADRVYYGVWTVPPLKFLYYNIAQSLAVFYGRNDWHYYLSQGYPLLLTTALPFTIAGFWSAFTTPANASNKLQTSIRVQLATVCIAMPAILSFISHKEVRFIYPLLPPLHILTAPALESFFSPAVFSASGSYFPRKLLLAFLVLVNVVIALYTTQSHASGPVKVLDYIRRQDDQVSMQIDADRSRPLPPLVSHFSSPVVFSKGLTVGFLTPCHSTPWRSHLVSPTITAWALSCEPPVNLNVSQRETYLDEADQFYADPTAFLRQNMIGGLRAFPRAPTYHTKYPTQVVIAEDKHPWPDYLVFFAQLEPSMSSLLRASSYAECYRTWNTAWHDDWRRKGDMVVWCLDPAVQRDWREKNKRLHVHEDGWEALMKSKVKQFDAILEQLGKESADVWSGKKARRWLPSLSLPRGWSWGPPSKSFAANWLWNRGSQTTQWRWSWSWSWPWVKRQKLSWSDVMVAWYDKILSDRSKPKSSDLWS